MQSADTLLTVAERCRTGVSGDARLPQSDRWSYISSRCSRVGRRTRCAVLTPLRAKTNPISHQVDGRPLANASALIHRYESVWSSQARSSFHRVAPMIKDLSIGFL